MQWTETERAVLTALQRGIEPVDRPFRGMALPETDVVELLRTSMENGLVRRFGGVFDARRLGYKSVLCALDVAPDSIEEKAAVISAHPGVTHCYERRPLQDELPYPALWFTLALPQESFDDGMAHLRAHLAVGTQQLLELPALRRFKIDVVFDLRTRDRDEWIPGSPGASPEQPLAPHTLNHIERELVRLLHQLHPVSERPFDPIARQLGLSVDEVTTRLREWKKLGILRRIAAVLYHREAGFKVNGMCAWPVDEREILTAGRRVAAHPVVTHCYQRPRMDPFPFDLYAMIHTPRKEETVALYQQITTACGLSPGTILISVREFKKSSMNYFADE